MYQHRFANAQSCDYAAPGKAVCVGRNYLAHIKELNNAIPSEPLLFIKANHCFTAMSETILLPSYGECHNELEVALLIGKSSQECLNEPLKMVTGVGLALDLTLRDIQTRLKSEGAPWERAKSFDGSCPVSPFVPIDDIRNLQNLNFSLMVNGEKRQVGNTENMMYSCEDLLKEISTVFSLLPGDIVLTGTPEGVGPLSSGDRLCATLEQYLTIETWVK